MFCVGVCWGYSCHSQSAFGITVYFLVRREIVYYYCNEICYGHMIICYVVVSVMHVLYDCPPVKRKPEILMSHFCLESQDCQFVPICLYLLSCSSTESCRYFCLILFCFWPILPTSFSLNLLFPKGTLLGFLAVRRGVL